MNRQTKPHLSAIGLVILASIAGCKDPDTIETAPSSSLTTVQQPLVAGRPSFAEFMRERAQRRQPRPAPSAKSPAAAAKLADFERKVAENAPAWAGLSAAERKQKRAELKHDMFIGRPGPANSSKKR